MASEETLVFNSISYFGDRGKEVFVVQNNVDCDNFNHLIGHSVLIDGAARSVVAVERFMHTPPWRKGEEIALVCAK